MSTYKALEYAIRIIENYELDLRFSKETIGIDLIKKGFCQGKIYTEALRVIEQKRNESD